MVLVFLFFDAATITISISVYFIVEMVVTMKRGVGGETVWAYHGEELVHVEGQRSSLFLPPSSSDDDDDNN